MSASNLKMDRRNFLKTSGLTAAAAITAYVGTHSAPAASAASASADVDESNCILGKTTPEIVFDKENPIAETTSGWVRGFIDNGIYTFRGIPYAEADRFEEPHKPSAWAGIRNAVVFGGMAPQAPMRLKASEILNAHTVWPMEENCQKLNVWSKDVKAKKPVMFWIHGGGYSTGSCIEQPCYDGRNLCENGDVVVVSINHRLNCLGFLDLSAYGEEYRYSGNLGLLDIVAALQWVQDNISRFGGDPDNVTLLGQSGGGGKVLHLMDMPVAKGLFHKGIVQSGFRSTLTQNEAQTVTKFLFEELGLPEGDVASLKKLDYDKIRVAGDAALKKASASWSPVVDGDCLPVNSWTADGESSPASVVPMIVGSCFAEQTSNALKFVNGSEYEKNSWDATTVDAKLTEAYGSKKDAVVVAFQKAYPNKPLADALYVELPTTGFFGTEAKGVLERQATRNVPVYRYMFSYEFPVVGGLLPWHCSDLPFVFGNVSKHGVANGATKEGHKLETIMLKAWAAFAHNGDPNHPGMIDWPQYTNENGAAMIFDKTCRIGYHHDDELFAVVQD
ncbi:MAG: carboxylesterase family protein [Faecalibacterium sp.]